MIGAVEARATARAASSSTGVFVADTTRNSPGSRLVRMPSPDLLVPSRQIGPSKWSEAFWRADCCVGRMNNTSKCNTILHEEHGCRRSSSSLDGCHNIRSTSRPCVWDAEARQCTIGWPHYSFAARNLRCPEPEAHTIDDDASTSQCIILAGPEKTASTHLQRFLQGNTDSGFLPSHGWAWPPCIRESAQMLPGWYALLTGISFIERLVSLSSQGAKRTG